MKLHHVGYVVPEIAATIEGFARSLVAAWDGCTWHDPRQKVKVAFLTKQPGEAQIELVEPAGADSPVARFLKEKGSGLHHVCYEVDDLAAGLAAMKLRGAWIAQRPAPAVAFQGRSIAWVITREKLLVELLETAAAYCQRSSVAPQE
jgi:methylmalonyl-CoA/ethylmalonyl-CoA epimerase